MEHTPSALGRDPTDWCRRKRIGRAAAYATAPSPQGKRCCLEMPVVLFPNRPILWWKSGPYKADDKSFNGSCRRFALSKSTSAQVAPVENQIVVTAERADDVDHRHANRDRHSR